MKLTKKLKKVINTTLATTLLMGSLGLDRLMIQAEEKTTSHIYTEGQVNEGGYYGIDIIKINTNGAITYGYCLDYGKTYPNGSMSYNTGDVSSAPKSVQNIINNAPKNPTPTQYAQTQLAIWREMGAPVRMVDSVEEVTSNEPMLLVDEVSNVENVIQQAIPKATSSSITASPRNGEFTLNGNYYESNWFNVAITGNLTSYRMDIKGQPSGTQILNASGTVVESLKPSDSKFKLRVPKSSVDEAHNIQLRLLGHFAEPQTTVYTPNNSSYQRVLGRPTLPTNTHDRDYINLTLTPVIENGTLRLVKKSETGSLIQGARFSIVGNGVTIEKTTGADGTFTVSDLKEGTYTVTETYVPKPYLLDPTPKTVTIEAEKTSSVEFVNSIIKGRVKVTKIDEETGATLQGAEFNLINKATGKVVEKLVTGENGSATSSLHNYGEYYIQEVKAPNGYNLNDTQHPVTIDENMEVVEVTAENLIIKGRVKVTKVDEETGATLQGAEFNLINKATGEVVEKLITGEDGTATSSLHNYGEYYIQEVKAPTGYNLNNTKHAVTIDENMETVGVTAENLIIKGRVKVTKVDEETKATLQGAEFNLINKATGEVVEKLVTGADGTATSSLHNFGEYLIQEIKAPHKYTLNGTQHPVTIDENMEVVEVTAENRIIKGQLAISKSDNDIKDLMLQGVEFEVTNADGEVVDTLVTDENGYAISKLLDYGTYYLQETKPLPSHLPNDTVIEVKVTEDGKVYKYDIENEVKKASIQIVKVDSENEETPIEGAVFDVIAENVLGIEKGTVVDTVTTDENGFATTKALRYGDYIVKEVEAPEGFYLNETEYHMSLIEHNKIYVKYIKNDPIQAKLRVIKTDGEEKFPLKDVEFKIVNKATGKDVVFMEFIGIIPIPKTVFKTNENGEFITPQVLKFGEYQLVEISTNEGYILAEPIDFTIDEDTHMENIELLGTFTTQEVVNNRVTGNLELAKVDVDTKEPIAGVEFEVRRLDNVFTDEVLDEVYTIKTNEDGVANLNDLEYGKYEIVEIKSAEGYVLSTEPTQFNIRENGEMVKVEIKNEKIKGQVEVLKVDSATDRELTDVKFEIYDLHRNLVDTLITDENGYAISQELPYGKYIMKEVETDENYVLSDETIEIEIKEDGKVHQFTVKNDVKANDVNIIKVDSESKAPLYGATMKIQGISITNEYITKEFVTAEDNTLTLPVGDYEVTEVKAPNGYVLSDEVVTFTVHADTDETLVVEFGNDTNKGKIEVLKVDSETDRVLSDVKFEIYDLHRNLVDTLITDENGYAISRELPYGKYIMKEVQTDENYILSDELIEIDIKEDGEVHQFTVKNDVKTGELEFEKTDVATGEVLEGAEIEITGLDEQNKHIKVEFTSSKDGNKFTLPVGRYEFKETVAPNGYILSEEVGTFEITENGITKANLKNELKPITEKPVTGVQTPLFTGGLALIGLGLVVTIRNKKQDN